MKTMLLKRAPEEGVKILALKNGENTPLKTKPPSAVRVTDRCDLILDVQQVTGAGQ